MCFEIIGEICAVANGVLGTYAQMADSGSMLPLVDDNSDSKLKLKPQQVASSKALQKALIKKINPEKLHPQLLELSSGQKFEYAGHQYKLETNAEGQLFAEEVEVGRFKKIEQFFNDKNCGTNAKKRLAMINSNLVNCEQRHYKVEVGTLISKATLGINGLPRVPPKRYVKDYRFVDLANKNNQDLLGGVQKNGTLIINQNILNFLIDQQKNGAKITLTSADGKCDFDFKAILAQMELNVDEIDVSASQKNIDVDLQKEKAAIGDNKEKPMTDIYIDFQKHPANQGGLSLSEQEFATPIKKKPMWQFWS